MKYKIVIEEEAINDLVNIKTYISKDSTKRANDFISELKSIIKTLDTMPNRCRKSLYTKSDNTHDIIYKGYTIVYKIIKNNVYILTIFKRRNFK